MTNDEIRMTKEFRNPNDEGQAGERAGTFWTFVLGHSFDIRHSDLVIARATIQMRNAECGMKATDH
ncbi:MAG: hypothetical protein DME24_13400 [Verrucomicrobia bacterium]|nr:MAG: hypothetical protein DME24_13400 [Verrucomicrobiota bacterium]